MDVKLYILNGPQGEKEHRIHKENIIVGRRDKEKEWHPDVDLDPDKKISRKHLKIWQQEGGFRIKDLKSRHGTLVDGEEIRGKEEGASLNLLSEIRIGETVLRFEPLNHFHLEHHGLKIDFGLLEIVNLALIHCGFPLISRLEIYNNSSSDSEPQEISFLLCGYSEETVVNIPFLKPGQSISIGDIYCKLDALRLEGQSEKAAAQFSVKIKDKVMLRKDISVLAYNEFSLELQPEHQASLASFIQPAHPLVEKIIRGIKPLAEFLNSGKDSRFKQITQVIYDYLATQYSLSYEKELSYSSEQKTQEVRLTHHILEDSQSKQGCGRGTCIDLSILLAACLENIGLKPLIFLVKGKNALHAFAGSWQGEDSENVKPLLSDKEALLHMADSGRLLFVECTGFTQGKERLSFDMATVEAAARLRGGELLYALDISAARTYGGREGISPLPLMGTPHYSEEVEEVLNKARKFALISSSKVLGAPHLLLGLLELKDGLLQKIFREQEIDPILAGRKIIKGLQDNTAAGSGLKPSYHYEEVIKIAAIIARRKESAFVKEAHLIEALLEVRSDALERALGVLSTTPRQCLEILYRASGLTSSFTSSRSFFRDK